MRIITSYCTVILNFRFFSTFAVYRTQPRVKKAQLLDQDGRCRSGRFSTGKRRARRGLSVLSVSLPTRARFASNIRAVGPCWSWLPHLDLLTICFASAVPPAHPHNCLSAVVRILRLLSCSLAPSLLSSLSLITPSFHHTRILGGT